MLVYEGLKTIPVGAKQIVAAIFTEDNLGHMPLDIAQYSTTIGDKIVMRADQIKPANTALGRMPSTQDVINVKNLLGIVAMDFTETLGALQKDTHYKVPALDMRRRSAVMPQP